MAVPPKDRPEFPGHRKDNALVRNVGECGPLFPLPSQGRSMPATRTSSRFAGVVNKLLFGIRFVYFGAQRSGPAFEYLVEFSTDDRTSFSAAPVSSSCELTPAFLSWCRGFMRGGMTSDCDDGRFGRSAQQGYSQINFRAIKLAVCERNVGFAPKTRRYARFSAQQHVVRIAHRHARGCALP
jgi:hypothetical protein